MTVNVCASGRHRSVANSLLQKKAIEDIDGYENETCEILHLSEPDHWRNYCAGACEICDDNRRPTNMEGYSFSAMKGKATIKACDVLNSARVPYVPTRYKEIPFFTERAGRRGERAQEPITGEEDSREENARSDTRKSEAEAKANQEARGG